MVNTLIKLIRKIFMSEETFVEQGPVADQEPVVSDDVATETVEAPVEEAPVEEAPVEEAPVEEAPVEEPVVVGETRIYYEGAYITGVLDESREGFKHCSMSDGTTKDVPVELFNS